MKQLEKTRVELWVKALRSGEYTQGKSFLEQRGGEVTKHCCLGVACRVAIRNGLKISVFTREAFGVEVTDFDNCARILPMSVANWYGLESTDPQIEKPYGGVKNLSEINDTDGWSFDQVADAIESQFVRK